MVKSLTLSAFTSKVLGYIFYWEKDDFNSIGKGINLYNTVYRQKNFQIRSKLVKFGHNHFSYQINVAFK